jgi:BON domain
MQNSGFMVKLLRVAVAASLLVVSSGCKKQTTHPAQPVASAPVAPTDQQISADITSRLNAESALNGQNIQVDVTNGRATLNGTVTDEASRSLASNDAGAVNGVKTVINNLTVAPVKAAVVPPPIPVPPARRAVRKPSPPKEVPPPPPVPVQQASQPQPPEPVREVAPPPPPQPIVKVLILPAGTTVSIRMTDALETGQTQANAVFHASLAADLVADGTTAIPRGATVLGRVVDAKDATHYAGSSALTLELTQISSQGQTYHIVTDSFSQQGKGRGSNTAKKVGGGAAIGAVIGALAGGGKGAAIGAAAGGGVGAGANTITKGEQVKIPSETLLQFRLQNPVSVTTTIMPPKSNDNDEQPQQDPNLQQR